MSKVVFEGFSHGTIEFFAGIMINNDKAWFDEHKKDYEQYVLNPLKDFVTDLIPTMIKIDPEFEARPEKCIPRINRDIRFSKDKSPYKTSMWLSFKRGGKEWMGYPGYYFEINANGYGYGMGFYDASKETMDNLREIITGDKKQFDKAIKFMKEHDGFGLGGEMYKKPLRDDLSADVANWYQRKSVYVLCDRPIIEDVFNRKIFFEVEKVFGDMALLYKLFLGCVKTIE